MSLLYIIKTPIEREMVAFDNYFKSQFKSDVPLLNCALSFISESVGKQMRPMLVMLVAKCISDTNNKVYAVATAMEMLHTASLLHDDVVDESDKRRGRPSVNTKFNNNIAVLTGDFLFSQSLNNAAVTQNTDVVQELSILGKALARGEILQMEMLQNGAFSEENYLNIIYCKTASLFICSCVSAVLTAGGSEEQLNRFREFGRNVGICFQIKDDIFDYFAGDIGKPTGSDMREGKITLPALYVLNNSKNPAIAPIKQKLSSGTSLDETEIETLIDVAKNEGGVEYANATIERYRTEAIESLPKDVSSELRDALVAYMDYTISRNK